MFHYFEKDDVSYFFCSRNTLLLFFYFVDGVTDVVIIVNHILMFVDGVTDVVIKAPS